MKKSSVTIYTVPQPEEPIPYEHLPGEHEFFVALHGGEEAHALWCWAIMYGEDEPLHLT